MQMSLMLLLVGCAVSLGGGCRPRGDSGQAEATQAPVERRGASPGGAIAGASPAGTTPVAGDATMGRDSSEGEPLPLSAKPHVLDLARLQKINDDKTMPAQDRLDALLGLLREELANPSWAFMGVVSGPGGTGYVQGMIVGFMGETVPVDVLARARAGERDPAIRQRLTIALGVAGDPSVVPELTEVLSHQRLGDLRAWAAEALLDLKDPRAKDALRAALNDKYGMVSWGSASGSCVRLPGDIDGYRKVYPVRSTAGGALMRLGEKVDPAVCFVPLDVDNVFDALYMLFEDRDPETCLNVVQSLSGEMGKPYLKRFLEEYDGDENLKQAVDLAKALLQPQDSPPAEPAPQ
jgi:hypothetical protein